jgi:ABC-2 type transport system ATP-binding protein
VPGGSILGLIGENGAGKTTTIKCIMNLVRRDGGEISVLGRDMVREELAVKQDVGVVLDECFFHDTLRAGDLDRILSPVYRNWDSVLFRDYLNKFRLPERKFIKEYSRGMKMKLSLAAALAHRPKLLVLDEATSGLDPVVRDEILEEFQAFVCDEEHGVLLSSHITSDLEKVADYIAYIHRGQVRLAGAKDELLERHGRLVCTARQLEELEPGELVQVRRGTYGCEGLVADRAAFARRHPELTVDRVSLEEIMLFIGKGDAQ